MLAAQGGRISQGNAGSRLMRHLPSAAATAQIFTAVYKIL